MSWRAPFSLLLTAAFAAVFISGCEQGKGAQYIEGWYWVPDKNGLMPCAYRRWIWIPEDHDEAGYWSSPARSSLMSHVVPDLTHGRNDAGLLPCDVFSKMSEPVARVMRAPALPYGFASESVFEHEARHWRGGLVHPT